MDEPDYALALAFWSLLAEERAEFAGGRALAHSSVPYLLANAAWFAQPERLGPEDLEEVAAWCEARALPPAVVVPSARAPTSLLRTHGFAPELRFAFRTARNTGGSNLVEQVGWTGMGYAGALLAAHYGQPDLAAAIGQDLSRVLQTGRGQPGSGVRAFLSYRDAPVGTMLSLGDEHILAAPLLVDPDGSLEGRLALEAALQGQTARLLTVSPAGEPSPTALARWSRARAGS